MLGGGAVLVIMGATLLVRSFVSPGTQWLEGILGGALVGAGVTLVKAGWKC